MLSKLFKYEMRATAKTFMWLYIAFAVIAIVSAVLAPWSPLSASKDFYQTGEMAGFADTVPQALQAIVVMLYFLAIAAMVVVTLVVIILRFYRNLLGDEGYLMMTLPVTREEHMLSKLLVALIWSICTMVIISLSILLFIAVSGYFGEFVAALNELFAMGLPFGRWIAMLILATIISSASGIMMLYAAMSIGPNLLKNRLGGSILAFIIIYIASQLITVIVMLGWASAFRGSFINESVNFSTGNITAGPGMAEISNFAIYTVDSALGASIITYAVIGVGCWFLTRYMLKKKLNLA